MTPEPAPAPEPEPVAEPEPEAAHSKVNDQLSTAVHRSLMRVSDQNAKLLEQK